MSHPPSAFEVAERAIVLKHVVVYALTAPLRDMLSEITDEGLSGLDDFWAELGPLRQALSPWERELSRTTILTMTEAQQIDASWRVEAFQVLLWALGLLEELPQYDEQADHDILKIYPPTEGYLDEATLIDGEVVEWARDLAELWHWRSRTRQLQDGNDPFPAGPEMAAAGFHSYDDIVRSTARRAHEHGDLAAILDEDFVAFGKAYRDLTPEEWSLTRSITIERHFALNWLCGYAPGNRWDETPTDT